jgi:hypothetical protein
MKVLVGAASVGLIDPERFDQFACVLDDGMDPVIADITMRSASVRPAADHAFVNGPLAHEQLESHASRDWPYARTECSTTRPATDGRDPTATGCPSRRTSK